MNNRNNNSFGFLKAKALFHNKAVILKQFV